MRVRVLAALSVALFCGLTLGADWPSFRGPDHTGVAPEADPPIEWGEDNNVRWKIELEGTGHASPVIWGNRVYVMSALKIGTDEPKAPAPQQPGSRPQRAKPTQIHRFTVSAHDLATGKRVWHTVVKEDVPHESLHSTASQVSASPVTDGKHIWAFFGSRGLYCLDMDGKIQWKVEFGTQSTRNEFGEGASPAVHGDFIVINWDHEGDSFVAALDKATGKERWRVARDEPTSWSTPLVVRDGEREIVVVSAASRVVGYDLVSGKEIWSVSGLGVNPIPTPVADDETVWVMSGYRDPRGMAIRYRGASGDLAGTDRIRWQIERGLSYVPSAVLVDGRIFFFQRFTGILSCYELSSGKTCYDQQRIDGYEDIYASLVAAGDRIYSVSRDGSAVVFDAGDEFKILARNELDDVFNATPAIVGNTIILRGDRFLYNISAE
jgi:outer membrane protein assembly factor BamB